MYLLNWIFKLFPFNDRNIIINSFDLNGCIQIGQQLFMQSSAHLLMYS